MARQAVDADDTDVLALLSTIREEAGDQQEAEQLDRSAAAAGNSDALARLIRKREEAGDPQGAEQLALQVANAGGGRSPYFSKTPLHDRWPHGLDPDGTPTPPW
ncbi:hypothetical protein ACFTZI_01170 [Streptomyces decoyicus]|uniref:hypothetical protein n=1 Tax=Streptomyces decoyicus TaxID=249567 RepID=UPI003644080F